MDLFLEYSDVYDPSKALRFEALVYGEARECPYSEFLSLQDPSIEPNGSFHLFSNDGFELILNGKAEVAFVKAMAASGWALAIHGQNYAIPYQKPWANTPSPFQVDFIIYTHKKEIVFLELKSILGMAQDENILKYQAMREFCKKRGYLYAMVDIDGVPFEEYFYPEKDSRALSFYIERMDQTGTFNENDMANLLAHYPSSMGKFVRRAIAASILQDPHVSNRYCHDDPRLVNAVKENAPLPYKMKKAG